MINESVRKFLHEHPDAPTSTPWGAPQALYRLADGIYKVITAEHGGIFLTAARMGVFAQIVGSSLAQPFQRVADLGMTDGSGWFEEDEAAYLVHYFFHADIHCEGEPAPYVREQVQRVWPSYFAAAQEQVPSLPGAADRMRG